MPYSNFRAVYVPTGNPDTVHYKPPYAEGETGASYDAPIQRSYQVVMIDPDFKDDGPAGPILANQVAIWKNKALYTVTNDRAAVGNTAEVAGIFRVGVDDEDDWHFIRKGELVHVLQHGFNIPVASDGTGAAGDLAILAHTGALSRVTHVTRGTAPGYPPIGMIRGAAVAGVINIDVNIQPTT